MYMTRLVGLFAPVALLLSSSPAHAAADKAQQQLMAEIRMLQQQQQELHVTLGALADTLQAITGKLDDQSGAVRKAFADQKLLIDSVSETVRILREKADDTNVRLSTMSHELEAMRQAVTTLATQPQAPASMVGQPPTDPSAPAPPPAATPPPGVSPQRMFEEAFSDYTRGDY
jgi:prefoldin subunit 5